MTYRALLIGNSTFDADDGLNPLNAPTKDVARLHHALVHPDTGLFNEDNTRLVIDRTHDPILDELDTFFGSGRRDDMMLLYYSGHGILDEFGHLNLCARDTRSDRLARTGISDEVINSFIRNAASMRTILILDCCSSGMFKGGAVETQLGGPGRYIVSSARGKTLANDSQSPTGTSLFTEHLVEGLLGGASDVNGDGLIDLREIYDYVKRRLAETSKQIPHSRFDGDGDVSVARSKGLPTPAIAIATDAGKSHRAASAPFGLSETVISLHDVAPDERLRPELIEVCRFTDDDLDLSVETLDDWLQVELTGDRLSVTMTPRAGNNRGKILVRDRISGAVQTLRVEAFLRSSTGRTGRVATATANTAMAGADTAKAGSNTAMAGAATTTTAAPPPVASHSAQPLPPPWSPLAQSPAPPPPQYNPPQYNPGQYNPQQYNPPQYNPGQHNPPQQNPIYQPMAPPPFHPGPGVTKSGTNGSAIASLVLSLVWIYGIGSVLGIIFARKAKKEMAQTGQGGSGLATAGNIIGWLGLLGLAVVIIVAIAAKPGS